MTPITTPNHLEALMAGLVGLVEHLEASEMYDEAEVVESVMPFLKLLRDNGQALLSPDPIQDDTPVEGDMETLRELAVKFKTLQSQLADLKAESAEVRNEFDFIRIKKIPDLMESLGVKTATFSGVGRVQTAPDLRASTKKGQKPTAIQWLRDSGYDGMVQESYNASSLKALFRRMIVDGIEIPEEIFNVMPFTRASVVKA